MAAVPFWESVPNINAQFFTFLIHWSIYSRFAGPYNFDKGTKKTDFMLRVCQYTGALGSHTKELKVTYKKPTIWFEETEYKKIKKILKVA